MTGILSSVDQRTRLVGENRLELLLFRLNGRQLFAINVFKVQEVVKLPQLNQLPSSHSSIRGVVHLRGRTLPVIDLGPAIGLNKLRDLDGANLIVAEYNRSVQAFLIGPVDRIVNLNWEDILPPPKEMGRNHFLTAITRVNNEIVEILDVERILAEVIPHNVSVSENIMESPLIEKARAASLKLLLAEDSYTAANQISEIVNQLGVEVICVQDGLQAWQLISGWISEGKNIHDEIIMLITDAEMPEMDGYSLTTELRKMPEAADLFIAMHTSLSGSFNRAMVEQVGCDAWLSKFQVDELASLILKRVENYFSA
ncbi:MAG: chemotaxis protein [Cellvibrio sp.]